MGNYRKLQGGLTETTYEKQHLFSLDNPTLSLISRKKLQLVGFPSVCKIEDKIEEKMDLALHSEPYLSTTCGESDIPTLNFCDNSSMALFQYI